tara:strand:- start:7915 stop:8124 length:210 start_codon:yes stop_codon:yes gene_type:complete
MKHVLQVKEVANILSMGLNQTYAALNRKEIPGMRIGNAWIIPRETFFSWLNTCNNQVKPEPTPLSIVGD